MAPNLLKTALSALAFFALAACERPAEDSEEPPFAPAPSVAAVAAAAESAVAEAQPAPPAPVQSLADSFVWPVASDYVRFSTSKGDMIVELYADKAPQSVANFLQYARDGHYDRTIFHRVVTDFVVQGGGFSMQYNERPTRPPIAYEGDNGLPNYRSTLAMARGRNPNSATSQWYVNLRDNNERLDHFVNDLGPRYGYAVFGRVIDGMAVADVIGDIPTGAGGPFQKEVPVEAVIVTRIERLDGRPEAAAALQ